MLLPLSDRQGEVSALAETIVLDKQLQSGQLEMPKMVDLVKDIDHDDLTHEESDHASNNTLGCRMDVTTVSLATPKLVTKGHKQICLHIMWCIT